MVALIRYPVGIIVEAVILAATRNRMRFAAAGFTDAVELRRSGATWLTEAGETVEFEFLSYPAEAAQKSSSTKRDLAACFAGSHVG
jgi:hypothetical protein